jgi:hypothetical protein
MQLDYGLILFLTFALLGVVWIVQCHRLFYTFRAKYPEVARAETPNAFSLAREPEKFFYFFRRKSYELLKSDSSLWNLRQQVKFLTITLFIVVPSLFFALWITAAIYILINKA